MQIDFRCPAHGNPPPELRRDVRGGHCIEFGSCVVALSAAAWSKAVRAPCPSCGRPWWLDIMKIRGTWTTTTIAERLDRR